jgi:SpoIID/LytB domain protein
VSYRVPSRGGWQKWTTFPGAAEFSAGNQPLTLRLPKHGSAQYRGALRSVEKHTVNVLPLDRYVQGVVPSEVPTSWPADAVRAQAVAARTYAAFERETATDYYDICDTTSCQVYGGVSAEDPAATAAVQATRGRVVLYEGEPAFTQFSSSNGGYSSAGSQPYLVAQPDPYEASSDNPNDPWTAAVTRAQLETSWPAVGTLQHLSFTRDGLGAQLGGRVTAVRLTGSLGGLPTSVNVTGDDFRSRLALKSTWLQLAPA